MTYMPDCVDNDRAGESVAASAPRVPLSEVSR